MRNLRASDRERRPCELVSVLLPTRNRAQLLDRCIESIEAQSYGKWELIVVDGASTDDTPSIARRYAENDPRIRYYRSYPRQGLPKDRNVAISLSRGELIMFIEDDLQLDSDCLEILVSTYNRLTSSGSRVGAVGPRTISETLTKPDRYRAKDSIARAWQLVAHAQRRSMTTPSLIDTRTGIIYRNWALNPDGIRGTVDVPAWSIIPRSIFNELGGYDYRSYPGTYMREETDFHFRIRRNGYELFFQPKAVAFHDEADSGGCNVSPIKYYYYFLRNHIIFLVKNFDLRSAYMIPTFILFITFQTIRFNLPHKKISVA